MRSKRDGNTSEPDAAAADRFDLTKIFSIAATEIARWTGSHWAMFIGAGVVIICLLTLGIERTNIAISIVTLLMLFILQNTQNRDSAAIHLKLDDLITNLHGPRDEIAGAQRKSEKEIEALEDREMGSGELEGELESQDEAVSAGEAEGRGRAQGAGV